MKILIINTSEKTGGAAVAAGRLMDALNNNGAKARMLVRDKQSERLTVVPLRHRLLMRWRFLWERWCIFVHLHFSRTHLFEIDIANVGADITSLREFREADIIHLHWINQGMLSLSSIRKILRSGKPVVWTMHDLWPATALCHYARGCKFYQSYCHDCRLLPRHRLGDLSRRVWQRKRAALHNHHVHFVACSRWLAQQAKRSALLTGHHVTNIPNAIDTRVFHPADKTAARQQLQLPTDRRLVLFVSQRVTDERKGMSYFLQAMNSLAKSHPEAKEHMGVMVLGAQSEAVAEALPFPVYPLGYVSDEKAIVNIYNAADVFVLPSLEDNLPNTIMEAMACGVPCVGFKVGGIPEMTDHQKNGYVARYRDSDDLARGIHWVLSEADYAALSREAVRKVAKEYSQNAVALRYIEVYNEALALKRYRL